MIESTQKGQISYVVSCDLLLFPKQKCLGCIISSRHLLYMCMRMCPRISFSSSARAFKIGRLRPNAFLWGNNNERLMQLALQSMLCVCVYVYVLISREP